METLIGLALKSLLIAGATLGLLHLTRARSAAERSWIAHLGLVALVALPLASLALPAMHIALPDVLRPATEVATAAPLTPVTMELSTDALTPATPIENAEPVAPVSSSVDWAPYAYAAPAVALLFITLLALLRLFALRHRAQVLVDPTWLSALAHAQRRMGFKNGTALLTSNELSSPISWGLMRPVILLNDKALEASGDAEAIIAHELAHVARLDWAKLMLARVATAIFWFNPLAWVLAREAHQLREEAADDAVLAANIADTDYAQLLVGVARHECKGLLLGAHGISPSKNSLSRRVRRVLDGTLARGPAQRSWVAGFAAGMLVMAAPLAALTFAPKEALPEDSLIGADLADASRAPASKQDASEASSAVGPSVAAAVSGAVTTALASTVEAVQADGEWSFAGAIARDVQIEADRAREDARDARRKAKSYKRDAIDTAIGMKALGVTPEYIAAVRAAGPQFRNLPTEEFMGLKVQGVTPQYVRALAEAGYLNESPDAIGDAAIMGVTASFIRDMAAAGYRGLSLDELTEMRTMGVSRAYIEQFRRAGYPRLTADQLIKMRTLGVRPEDVQRRRPPRPPEPIAAPAPTPAPTQPN